MGQKIWKHIISDYSEENLMYIDGYLTDDADEAGQVIAIINTDTYDIEYKDKRAEDDINVQDALKAIINDLIDVKEKMIEDLIEEIQSDINSGDRTVLDAILQNIPRSELIQSLSEEKMKKYLYK